MQRRLTETEPCRGSISPSAGNRKEVVGRIPRPSDCDSTEAGKNRAGSNAQRRSGGMTTHGAERIAEPERVKVPQKKRSYRRYRFHRLGGAADRSNRSANAKAGTQHVSLARKIFRGKTVNSTLPTYQVKTAAFK